MFRRTIAAAFAAAAFALVGFHGAWGWEGGAPPSAAPANSKVQHAWGWEGG